MLAVLLTVHLIACLSLVIAVLLQRSEGGALGMGGGGTGGLISGRGAAGALVKVTMVLAAVFFSTSILMTRLNAEDAAAPTDIEETLGRQGTGDFNSLGTTGTTGTTPPGATTTTPSAPPATTPAPAPTTPDPLAPAATPPTGATTPATPPATTTPTPAPARPAPATPDPLSPTPPNQ